MIDQVLALAQYAGVAIERRPELELLTRPVHRDGRLPPPRRRRHQHRDLFASGRAVIGRTRVDGAVALKLTLLNPQTMHADIEALLDAIVSAAT